MRPPAAHAPHCSRLMPSWAISIVSIAIALAAASNDAPEYLMGHPLVKLQAAIVSPLWLYMVIVPFLTTSESGCSVTLLRHSQTALSVSRPRLSTMFEKFSLPGTLRIHCLPSGVQKRSSMVSCEWSRPETSFHRLCPSTPSRDSPKKAVTSKSSWLDMLSTPCQMLAGRLLGDLGLAAAAAVLADPEDHELGGLDGADADLGHDLAGLDHVGGVGLGVALDVERLARRRPEERPAAPGEGEEVPHRHPQPQPQPLVVRLEDRPLGALDDRLGDVVEEPAHVEVAPLRIARERARAPDADAASREAADAGDALGVERALLGVCDLEGDPVRGHHALVGGGLVPAAGRVRAGPDAGHVA